MSQRDYRLTIRLDIDTRSLKDITDKLSDAFQKAFGKAVKSVGRVEAGVVKPVTDSRMVQLLTKMSTELAAMNGMLSRVIRTKGKSAKGGVGDRGGGGLFGGIRRLARGTGFVAKAVALGIGIYELVKRVVGSITEFSGYFKSSLKLLETVVGLFLKPFLDFIGLLLRPFLILMLPVAVALNRALAPFLLKVAKGDWVATITAILTTVAGYVLGRMGGQLLGGFLGQLVGRIAGATVGRVVGGAIGAIGGPLGMAAGFVVGGILGDFLSNLFTKEGREGIVKALNDFGKWLSDTFGGVAKWVGDAWDGFVKWINENLGGIGKFLGDAWSGFVTWMKNNIGAISGFVGDAWVRFVDWVSSNLGRIGEFVGNSWNGFVKWFGDNIGRIGDLVGGAWRGFIGWVSDNLGKIGSWIGSSWDGFVRWVNDNFGKISSFIGRAWDGFVKWITDNLGAIGRLIGDGWDRFVKFLTDVGTAIANTLKPVWDKIVEFFTWVGDKLGQLLRGDILGFFGFRGQFGLTVPRAGQYFLEAGELVLSRADVMRLVSALGNVGGGNTVNIAVTITGPVYGVDDLEERVRRVMEREAGNILYDIQRRGVR
jgi:hypothetical protein